MKPIVRIAPSPTGNLHIGTARATLFNFLFAKQNNGLFIVRIEDTDTERSKKEYEENIMEGLAWLGLKYDKIFKQSERTDVYKKYLEKMIADGTAYISKEDTGVEKKRGEVIRFKNPNKEIVFEDIIRGEVKFNTSELKDFVIAKSTEEPLYHLAVVIDDSEMNVTHIIRGEDHISNTPRQILIQEAIGAVRPKYAHLPLILGKDKSKLSKRHGATSLTEYRERGYLPEAVLNYLALLGWNPGDEREIFSLKELISNFNLEKVQKGGAVFDEEKLRWINREHIKLLSKNEREEKILEQIYSSRKIIEKSWKLNPSNQRMIIELISDKIHIWSDIEKLINEGELDWVFENPEYQAEKLYWKNEKDLISLKRHLEKALILIDGVPEDDFSSEIIKEAIWPYAEKEGRGSVLWPLRYALSGREKSPDPFNLCEILGKEESIKRIKFAINKVE